MDLEALCAQFFSHLQAGDGDAAIAMCADDAVLRQNTGPLGDANQLNAILGQVEAAGITLRYDNVERTLGDGVVIEEHDVVMSRADGVEAVGRACVLLHVNSDGKITRLNEYVDPTPFAPVYIP